MDWHSPYPICTFFLSVRCIVCKRVALYDQTKTHICTRFLLSNLIHTLYACICDSRSAGILTLLICLILRLLLRKVALSIPNLYIFISFTPYLLASVTHILFCRHPCYPYPPTTSASSLVSQANSSTTTPFTKPTTCCSQRCPS